MKRPAIGKSVCALTKGFFFFSQGRWRQSEALHREPFNPLSDKTLNGGKFFKFITCHKRKGVARSQCTSRAADAVDVVLRVLGHVIVDHVAHARHINSSRGNVGSDHDFVLARLEAAQGLDTLVLGTIGMQNGNGMVRVAQLLGDFVRAMLGARENKHALLIGRFQQCDEQVELPFGLNRIDTVRDHCGYWSSGADFNARWITQRPGREVRNFRRKGC